MEFDDATGLGVVCITDHAQSSLGDVVFVELPVVGTEVAKGGEFYRSFGADGCLSANIAKTKSGPWRV